MGKRIVIVGGVAAGASAAAKARRTSEDVEIVLFEAGPYISFANCGLPYYVGGEIADRKRLFVTEADAFAKRFNVDVRVKTRVTSVDADDTHVHYSTESGDTEEMHYDRLILATGTLGIVPPIEGIRRKNIFTVRTVPDVDAIVEYLSTLRPGEHETVEAAVATGAPLRAVVIGAGYIGLETAEQLRHRGLAVTLVEMASQVMLPMDVEMAVGLQKGIEDAGCGVILGDGVARIVEKDGRAVAVTAGGRELPFDIGILAVGVKPNVDLAREAGLKLGATGAIAVDAMQHTSVEGIYAAGDNSETAHLLLDHPVNIALAGPANKAGRVAGANAALDLMDASDDDPRRLRFAGVLGTAIVRVGKAVGAVTGLTEKQAAREGIGARVVYMPGFSHAGYYPGGEPMLLKLLYRAEDGRILGAQAVGGEGVDKRIDVLAAAITGGMTVEDLENLDLCYAPPFGSARDIVIQAGLAAANERRGLMPSITPAELLTELESEAPPVVIDARTPKEFADAHLPQAVNIPVDELRARIDEVPADRPVAVHCAGGYRSYIAVRMLMNAGRTDVRNVLGGYGLIRKTQAAMKKK